MGRTVRSNNVNKTPYVKPVEKVELSEKHLKRRVFLVVLLVLVAGGAFAYGVGSVFKRESGWQTIQASAGKDADCSNDFVFLYNLGAGGISASAEGKIIQRLYKDACIKGYQVFHHKKSFGNLNNVHDINMHPNEEIVVDELLYQAFETIKKYKNRNIFLGPVYNMYDDIFYCEEDYQLKEFDPQLNPEIAAYYREIAAFANDPAMVDVQLLGNNTICLVVSDEYAAYAEENEITHFIDFFWMKNAFIVDYIAEVMNQEGYVRGCISSFDGFIRNMDTSGTSYSVDIYGKIENSINKIDVMEYTGPMSIVYYRNYVVNEADRHRYYVLDNGEIRTSYVDAEDGVCKSSLDNLYVYSEKSSCAEILMQTLDIYIADEFEKQKLLELEAGGIHSRYFYEK